jgi:hydrogenase maturation protease
MKILVAGIGNIFLGDDAFGVEVVQRFSAMPLPPGVTLADFGIRSYDLAYAMMDGYDVTILLTRLPRSAARNRFTDRARRDRVRRERA